jgi:NADH:ubiquinone oxidoreductase subunit E
MSASTTVHGESPSCGYSDGEDIAEDLKKIAKAMNCKGKLRVTRSGCMDLCAFDPNMMIWPEGLW